MDMKSVESLDLKDKMRVVYLVQPMESGLVLK